MQKKLQDKALNVTGALPAGATTTKTSAIDLGNSANGDFSADVEFLLEAPALTVTQLPNTKTVTYDVITSVNSDLSSPTVVYAGFVVQTGAGGAGAAAQSPRFRLPSNVRRYLGIQATGIATVAASDATMSLKPQF